MVELEINGQNRVHASKAADKCNGTSQNDLAEVDMELVRQVRSRMREEFEKKRDQYESSNFYQEVMDSEWPHTCWRFLKECNLSVSDAVEQIKKSILWRLENHADGPVDNSKLAKEFWHYGALVMSGKTKQGQDVFYIISREYRKADSRLIKHVLKFVQNMLVSWDQRNRRNFQQLTVVFDVTDTGLRNLDLEFMTWLISAMPYFPSRVHHIYVVGIPFLIRPFVRLVISLLPTVLSSRLHLGTFEQLVMANIEPESLPESVGGSAPETTRLAPLEAPWIKDHPEFGTDEKLMKSFEYTVCGSKTQEQRERLTAMQKEFEAKSI